MMRIALLIFIPSIAFAQAQPHIVMILADDGLRGHIAEFRTDSVDTAWTGDGDTATTNLDLIANDGVLVDHLVTSQVCTPTRATMLGAGHGYMPSHLLGGVQNMDQPVTQQIEFNPYMKTLVDYAHDLSFEVVFIGKIHQTRISWREQTDVETGTPGTPAPSWQKAMGFDRAPDVMVGNTRHASYLATLPAGSPTLDANDVDCLGHNDFVRCDLEGVCTQQTALHSTVYFMNALQADLTSHTNTKTLYLFFPPVAHIPLEFGTANNCAGGTRTQDDRIAGSACADKDCVYEEFITNLDTEIGALMADMNGGGGLLCADVAPADGNCDGTGELITDTLLFTWDNGLPVTGVTSPNDCISSAGIKNSPFPCGVVNGMVAAGKAITPSAAGGHITSLHEMADIPKTLEQMMGGTGKGMTRAGTSFMDCLDGTVTLANCPGVDFVPYIEFAPLGSTLTVSPRRIPDCSTDSAAAWTDFEVGGWTYEFNDRYLLHRVFDMDGTCNYTEQLYATAGTTDRYVVLDAEQPIADSGPTAAADNFIDCAISGADWAATYTEDQDDSDACSLLHRKTDAIIDTLGIPTPLYVGMAPGPF